MDKRQVMFKNGPIIIIEDDPDDQELLKDLLGELKVTNILKFFSSCLEAFEYLLNSLEKPFLILSDINLPAMTGLDLCRKIKENEFLRLRSVPFVFLTTTSDSKVIKESYEMNVQGFFVKPSNIKELKEMLRRIIDYWSVCRHPT